MARFETYDEARMSLCHGSLIHDAAQDVFELDSADPRDPDGGAYVMNVVTVLGQRRYWAELGDGQKFVAMREFAEARGWSL